MIDFEDVKKETIGVLDGSKDYYLIDGHKLNYAIERALGIPAKVIGRHLIEPSNYIW